MNYKSPYLALLLAFVHYSTCVIAADKEIHDGLRSPDFEVGEGRLWIEQTQQVEGNLTRRFMNVMAAFPVTSVPVKLDTYEIARSGLVSPRSTDFAVYSKIRSAKVTSRGIEVFFEEGDLGAHGIYLALEKHADNSYRRTQELCLLAFRALASSFAQDFKDVTLVGNGVLKLTHPDGFVSELRIQPDNQVFINGRPCAPDGASVIQIHYGSFLNALSPTTALLIEAGKPEYRPILWWSKDFPKPPYTYKLYLEICKVIRLKDANSLRVLEAEEMKKGTHTEKLATLEPVLKSDKSQGTDKDFPTHAGEGTAWLITAGVIIGLIVVGVLWRRSKHS